MAPRLTFSSVHDMLMRYYGSIDEMVDMNVTITLEKSRVVGYADVLQVTINKYSQKRFIAMDVVNQALLASQTYEAIVQEFGRCPYVVRIVDKVSIGRGWSSYRVNLMTSDRLEDVKVTIPFSQAVRDRALAEGLKRGIDGKWRHPSHGVYTHPGRR